MTALNESVEPGDFIVGWDGNVSKWYLAVDGGRVTDHALYRGAIADLLENYTGQTCWYERDGGGIVDEFDPYEAMYSGWEGEDY